MDTQPHTLDDRHTRMTNIRPRLLSYARLLLRDHAAAEDVVQEALIAAIENNDSFSGNSSYETWIFGILKHKIFDEMRRQKNRGQWYSFSDESTDDVLDKMFQHDGRWKVISKPQPWAEPDQTFENEHFWKVFDACMLALPENIARVFSLRELMGLSTENICKEVGIKETNVRVILHRARLRLRDCIEKGWSK